jgi:hypothetical protein
MPSPNALRFRSSPFIELKLLAELSGEQREPFLELERDPDFYGLLVPKPPLKRNLISVTRQTADLFRSLATPSHLDDATLADADTIDLVLDGVLEVEGEDGFVSGADAFALVCDVVDEPVASDATARLSRDALLYAQDLETSDPIALTQALYRYNRIPLSPFWKHRFATAEAILAHLGADRGAVRALLERDWIAAQRPAFAMWSSKQSSKRAENEVTYKLYISPRPERIRDAFETVVRVLSTFPGTPFKIGNSATGLLRPDKFVAYFKTRERLGEAAAVLQRELAGCEAQGVPFTAALDESGLLSWGVDPPDSDRALQWLQRESWRYWVLKRLGSALAVARGSRSAAAVEPWRFAVERARRHGVDVGKWTPSPRLWSAA